VTAFECFRIMDGIEKDYVDSFKTTAELRSKVARIPKVQELYSGVPGFEP
jgi:hypothetical protein